MPVCEARLIKVWRERGAVVIREGDHFVINESAIGPLIWVGECAHGMSSHGDSAEAAQEATSSACRIAWDVGHRTSVEEEVPI